MGLLDKLRKNKIEGMIGYLGLESFWLSLSPEQCKSITRYTQSGLGADPNASPVEGEIGHTSATPLGYLYSFIGWAVADHDYELAEKVIECCNTIYEDAKVVDKHFYLISAADCYYKQREIRDNALALAEKYHMMDVKLFPKYKSPLMKEMGGILPRIPSFQQLAILYEKTGRLKDAIDICDLAIKYGLTDTTKGGFQGRKEKLMKKLEDAKKHN